MLLDQHKLLSFVPGRRRTAGASSTPSSAGATSRASASAEPRPLRELSDRSGRPSTSARKGADARLTDYCSDAKSVMYCFLWHTILTLTISTSTVTPAVIHAFGMTGTSTTSTAGISTASTTITSTSMCCPSQKSSRHPAAGLMHVAATMQRIATVLTAYTNSCRMAITRISSSRTTYTISMVITAMTTGRSR